MADTSTAGPNTTTSNPRTTQRPPTGDATPAAEARAFADETARLAGAGMKMAGELGRRSVETTRDFAEHGRQTHAQMADAWRQALAPMISAQLEATRWIDEAWRMMGLGGLHSMAPLNPLAYGPAPLFGIPPADVRETEQAYQVAIETPGLAREDLQVRLDGDMLTVCGCKRAAREETAGAHRLSERRFGTFERSFPIPPDVRREGVEATQKDGLLTITLPKAEEARTQRGHHIEIR
jgi:HSP20 family protein